MEFAFTHLAMDGYCQTMRAPESERTATRLDRPQRSWTFDQAIKDPSLEEPVDLHFHRRLAWLLLRVIERFDLPVTPVQLTLASTLLGIGAGYSYAHASGDARWYLAGTALLLLSIMFDCADGMLARLRNIGTHFGMLLDGICDLIVGVAVWYGVSLATTAQYEGAWVWPISFSILVSIVLHCAFYDGMKNSFVRLSTPHAQRGVLPIDKPIGTGLQALIQRIYTGAYGRVAAVTGGGLDQQLEAVDPITYQNAMAPVMRETRWLGLGTHLAIVYLACLFGLFRADAPFWITMAVVVVGLNVWMLRTLAHRLRVSRQLLTSVGEIT